MKNLFILLTSFIFCLNCATQSSLAKRIEGKTPGTYNNLDFYVTEVGFRDEVKVAGGRLVPKRDDIHFVRIEIVVENRGPEAFVFNPRIMFQLEAQGREPRPFHFPEHATGGFLSDLGRAVKLAVGVKSPYYTVEPGAKLPLTLYYAAIKDWTLQKIVVWEIKEEPAGKNKLTEIAL